MSGEGSFTTFLKSVFYKTCFFIGLGTASYYSYAQVEHWVSPAPTIQSGSLPASAFNSIQDKVDSLLTVAHLNSNLPSHSTTTAQAVMQHASSGLFVAPTDAPGGAPGAPKKVLTPEEVMGVGLANASPSPSASPGDEKKDDKKVADAKDGEKKEGEAKPCEVGKECKEGEGVLAEATPAQPQGMGFPLGQVADAQPQPSAAPVDPNAAAAAAAASGTGAAGIASAGAANAFGDSGTNYGAGGGTTYAGAGIPSASSGSVSLSSGDIAILSGTSMKATLAATSESVAGQQCSLDDSGNATGCTATNGATIQLNRWNYSYGLNSDVSFVVAATASKVKVNLTYKLQAMDQSYQSIAVSVSATDVISHFETHNSQTYKVYDLKLGAATVNGERLSSLEASLAFVVSSTTATTGTLDSTYSTFYFSRANVKTTTSTWDFSGTNRAPAANDAVVIATTIPYSMMVEKSQ